VGTTIAKTRSARSENRIMKRINARGLVDPREKKTFRWGVLVGVLPPEEVTRQALGS